MMKKRLTPITWVLSLNWTNINSDKERIGTLFIKALTKEDAHAIADRLSTTGVSWCIQSIKRARKPLKKKR